MNTIFVLIVIIGGFSYQSGIATITQEFNSFETCEIARKNIEAAHDPRGALRIRSQGCFKK